MVFKIKTQRKPMNFVLENHITTFYKYKGWGLSPGRGTEDTGDCLAEDGYMRGKLPERVKSAGGKGERAAGGPTALRRREEWVMMAPLLLSPPKTPSGPAPMSLDLTLTLGGGRGGPRRTAAPTELPQFCFTEENTPIVQNDLESHLV